VKSKDSVVINEIDEIAHSLYVKERERDNENFALSLPIFTIGHTYLQMNKEFYDSANLILREKKIKKIYHGIK
jgi:ribosome biogenesis protein Tsr3